MTHLMIDGNESVNVNKISKRGNSYRVSFDNKMVLTLSMEQVLEYRLTYEKTLTKEEFINLLDDINYYKWYDKCLKFVSASYRSEVEMKKYLMKSDLTADQQTELLNRLREKKIVDDYTFTKLSFDECIATGKGLDFFKNKLIFNEVKREYGEEFYDGFSTPEVIDDLVVRYQKYADKLTKCPKMMIRDKLFYAMLRNGIKENVISQVISRIEIKK